MLVRCDRIRVSSRRRASPPSARSCRCTLDTFLKLAASAADPAALRVVLLFTLVIIALTFAAAVTVFVWAFIIDRPIKLAGFEIPESPLKIETGLADLKAILGNKRRPELYDRNYTGDVLDSVEIPFDQEFRDAPKLVMGLVKVDAGAGLRQLPGGQGIVRLEVFAEVTRKGFTLRFKTWHESRLDNAAVSWMAIGR